MNSDTTRIGCLYDGRRHSQLLEVSCTIQSGAHQTNSSIWCTPPNYDTVWCDALLLPLLGVWLHQDRHGSLKQPLNPNPNLLQRARRRHPLRPNWPPSMLQNLNAETYIYTVYINPTSSHEMGPGGHEGLVYDRESIAIPDNLVCFIIRTQNPQKGPNANGTALYSSTAHEMGHGG